MMDLADTALHILEGNELVQRLVGLSWECVISKEAQQG